MGQQQLILLVLATVIVGLAIVVGIRAFVENSARANQDAIVQDLVRMASDAQAWKKKPSPFGGQTGDAKDDPDNFTGLEDLQLLGYETDAEGVYSNINGDFTITTAGTDGEVRISGQNCLEGNRATIFITGLTDGDITSVVESGACDETYTGGVIEANPDGTTVQ